jgi:hypothetical protein
VPTSKKFLSTRLNKKSAISCSLSKRIQNNDIIARGKAVAGDICLKGKGKFFIVQHVLLFFVSRENTKCLYVDTLLTHFLDTKDTALATLVRSHLLSSRMLR